MLNCIYDCKYCFLRGLYNSAHHVFFVNFEDFIEDIEATIKKHKSNEPIIFFSGYDSDSLVFDFMTGFVSTFFFLQTMNMLFLS